MRQSRLSGSVEGVMGNHDSYSDSNHKCFNDLFTVGYRMDRKGRYVHALGPYGLDVINFQWSPESGADTAPRNPRISKALH
jgi:hypothetical protein